MMKIFPAIILFALTLAGCAYRAEPLPSPAYNVVTSYGKKVPGKWLVYIDDSALDRSVKPATFVCSAHDFPLALSGPFRTSVNETLANILEQVEVVSSPVTVDEFKGYGAQGLIVVRGEEVRPRLETKPGFWSATMEGQALVVASVSVDGKHGRLFGSTVEGQGFASDSAGFACEGGAKALADAAAEAIKDTVRKIAEGISNSERVRKG